MKLPSFLFASLKSSISCLVRHNKAADPDGLSKGDEVTTIGGLTGKIVALDAKFITIVCDDDRSRLQFSRWAIVPNADNAQ